jgi:hypothetical protein
MLTSLLKGYLKHTIMIGLTGILFSLIIFIHSSLSTTLLAVSENLDGTANQLVSLIGCQIMQTNAIDHRIVAVGDIHGSFSGLLEDLYAANITISPTTCSWKSQTLPTTLIQMGDLVDRGPQALEALQCLIQLQKEASIHNAKVIRLLGNHELWWLSGYFHDRHQNDTIDKVRTFMQLLVNDISNQNIIASHVEIIHNIPILFVHAGFRKKFLKYLNLTSVEAISHYLNQQLVIDLQHCEQIPCKKFNNHELYEGGPDRGGRGIGGP